MDARQSRWAKKITSRLVRDKAELQAIYDSAVLRGGLGEHEKEVLREQLTSLMKRDVDVALLGTPAFIPKRLESYECNAGLAFAGEQLVPYYKISTLV